MEEKRWLKRVQEIFGADCPEKLAGYCRENWPEDVRHVLRTAEDACENTFLFDFRWDMERTWEPVHFDGEIDWSLIPKGDREFLWQFNRHRFLSCLSQAYQMTGEEKYAAAYVRLMTDWIDRAEPGANMDLGPFRTLETGIRAEVWLCSLPGILESGSVSQGFTDKVYTSLGWHQKRLAENYLPHKYISNWGVLESCGLLLLSLVLPDSGEYVRLALKRLEDAAGVQVLEDGTQWEQSPMYHNEVYHCFLTALYYGERAGIKMPEAVRTAVRKMAYVDYKWKKPDHTQFTQGDSDASDLRDQLTAGAAVLGDGMLKSGGYEILDYENAWRFGWAGCESYKALKAEEPDFVSCELPFSGNYYFRSGWGERENLLHFHCGETGGGHGHGDKLHVDLVICGEDVLVDSGRYTYVDGPERFWFKEATGHNVALVDKKGFAECETSWIYKNLCTCMKQQYFDGKTGSFVEGSHLGYWDRGVLVNRRIIWIKPDIYVLLDCFLSHGQHTYESLWHFSGHGDVREEENAVRFIGQEMEALIQNADDGDELNVIDTEQSWHYNEKHPNKTLVGTKTREGFCRKIAVIHGGKKGEVKPLEIKRVRLYSEVWQRELEPEMAEGLVLSDGKREYVLYLCYQEVLTPTDILSWENCLGHGKAVLFDRTEEKREILTGEILAW